MRLPKKDLIATALVAAAVLLYMLWLADKTLPGLGSIRATGVVILGLGFAASAVAVVPGFEQLLRGSRTYLAVTSLLGVVAFVSGVQMLLSSSGLGLGVLMVAMVAMWLIATTHHWMLATRSEPDDDRSASVPASHVGSAPSR
jgi:hypothetical protein